MWYACVYINVCIFVCSMCKVCVWYIVLSFGRFFIREVSSLDLMEVVSLRKGGNVSPIVSVKVHVYTYVHTLHADKTC